MSSDQILLGRLTKPLPRNRTHSRYVARVLDTLKTHSKRRGSKLPTICVEEELRDHDRVVIEGENCWSAEINQMIIKEFPNVDIYEKSEVRVELYVPVMGVPPAFAWKDFVASISVASLCGYLLYYFVL